MKSTVIVCSALVATIMLYQLISMDEQAAKRHKEMMEKLNILVDGEKFKITTDTGDVAKVEIHRESEK